ncbi:MAG: MHYT domain-containing protein [Myxococcales bacterium]
MSVDGTAQLIASYDYRVVALSILISEVGAYATLDIAERMKAAPGGGWRWLIGGAAASGMSTWSMHYIGMAALNLPVRVLYHWPVVIFSSLPTAAAAGLALTLMAARRLSWIHAVVGSTLLGGGIAALHYIAMGAMRYRGMHHYLPAPTVIAVILPMAITLVPLKLEFLAPGRTTWRRLRKTVSILLYGIANPAMHYTAMAGTRFRSGEIAPDLSNAVDISTLVIAGFTLVTSMAVGAALVTSLVDRLREQKAALDELFERTPQAVALTDVDGRVLRVNREFTRLFGFSATEALGRSLAGLIAPGGGASGVPAAGDRVEEEQILRRKDGSRLTASVVRVAVVARGSISVYGMYRDISAQKLAQEMLSSFSHRLIAAQEAERQRVARELHDEIGQSLTAIRLDLDAMKHAARDPLLATRLSESIKMVDHALEEVRELSLDLRPPLLDEVGLVAALRSFVDREARRAGLNAVVLAEPQDIRLHPELETACFRIAQEALTNVVRHAGARNVRLELARTDKELHLRIVDDGKGFDVEAKGRPGGLGLLGMRERALIAGGAIQIRSDPGRGTEVHVRFPLDGSAS